MKWLSSTHRNAVMKINDQLSPDQKRDLVSQIHRLSLSSLYLRTEVNLPSHQQHMIQFPIPIFSPLTPFNNSP